MINSLACKDNYILDSLIFAITSFDQGTAKLDAHYIFMFRFRKAESFNSISLSALYQPLSIFSSCGQLKLIKISKTIELPFYLEFFFYDLFDVGQEFPESISGQTFSILEKCFPSELVGRSFLQ